MSILVSGSIEFDLFVTSFVNIEVNHDMEITVYKLSYESVSIKSLICQFIMLYLKNVKMLWSFPSLNISLLSMHELQYCSQHKINPLKYQSNLKWIDFLSHINTKDYNKYFSMLHIFYLSWSKLMINWSMAGNYKGNEW